MVSSPREPDLADLKSWHQTLVGQAEELRRDIEVRRAELAGVEERLSLIARLLQMEQRASATDEPQQDVQDEPSAAMHVLESPAASAGLDLEEAVERLLRSHGKPMHIGEIRESLIADGVPIPGRGDDANIIVRLRKFEERFTRTARGTYGLAEWGLPALETRIRRPKRAAR